MNLTRQEKLVVLFLVCVALVGLGIDFLSKHFSQIRVIGYVSQDNGKININQAQKENLMEIKGIGEKLAQRIIDYRQKYGKFRDITELNNIQGIGKYKFEAIKDYFTVDPALSSKQRQGRVRKGGVE